ncbi:pilus assembly protein PilM, partial [Cutibacterium acnes]
QPFLDMLGQELGRALQFFFTSTPYNRIDHVLLSGGSASLPGIAEAVMAQTGFVARVLDPFEGMTLPPSVPAARLAVEATSYLVATGLALRRFVS